MKRGRPDYGGLTQDLFSAFWEQAFEVHFDREEIKVLLHCPQISSGLEVPLRQCVESSHTGSSLQVPSLYVSVSRELWAHSFGLRAFRNTSSRGTCWVMWAREKPELCLWLCLQLKESITHEQEDILFSVFTRFEMRIAPVWGKRLKEQLIKLTRFVFVLRPLCILQWMVDGVPKNHVDEL